MTTPRIISVECSVCGVRCSHVADADHCEPACSEEHAAANGELADWRLVQSEIGAIGRDADDAYDRRAGRGD